MRAIGYLREWSEAPPALSLERQQRAFLDACARRGLELGPTFTDLAPGDGQPELLRLFELARRDGQRGFAAMVVPALAVLGGSVREQWVRVLQAGALGLPLQLTDGDDADVACVRAWMSRGPEERRRERAIEGMRRRAMRGEVLGRPAYGYRVERTGSPAGGAVSVGAPHAGAPRSRLVPDDEEAPVVRRIFSLYLAEGGGVRRIAARLNADGVRTRRGGAWNMVSVRDLLQNPVYIGMYRRLGISIAGAHPALVTRTDFRAVQRRMAARRTGGGGVRRRDYPLSGIARCGYCGGRLSGMSRSAARGGEQRYYQCSSAASQGRCAAHTRRADDLEAEVLARIADGESREPLLEASPASADDDTREPALRRELERMFERRAAGEWTADRLQRSGGPIALELLVLEQRAAGIAPQARADDALGDARSRLLGAWPRLDAAERYTLLREVVREIVVTDDDVRVALA